MVKTDYYFKYLVGQSNVMKDFERILAENMENICEIPVNISFTCNQRGRMENPFDVKVKLAKESKETGANYDTLYTQYIVDKLKNIWQRYFEITKIRKKSYGTAEEPRYDFEFDIKNMDSDESATLTLYELSEMMCCSSDDISTIYGVVKKYFADSKRNAKRAHFDNADIIITDPCYIIKDAPKNPYEKPNMEDFYDEYGVYDYDKQAASPYFKWMLEHDDWEKCEMSYNMEAIGITNYICRDTLYGDWTCGTYLNDDTYKHIGDFSADAGLVAVFDLKEVLAYNPDFDVEKYINNGCATVIKNFTGDVWFEVEHVEGLCDSCTVKTNDCVYGQCDGDAVHVLGNGTVNFITSQNGF